MDNKNYYEILGISKDASVESIRKAYNREKFENGRYWDRELEDAYIVLTDLEKRKEYDDSLEQYKSVQDYSVENEEKVTEELEEKQEDVSEQTLDDEEKIDENIEQSLDIKDEKIEENKNLDTEEKQLEEVTDLSEVELKQETIEEIEQPEDDLKETEVVDKKFLKTVFLGSSLIFGFGLGASIGVGAGIVCGVATGAMLTGVAKIALKKDDSVKEIEDIKTVESELIEEYNKKLEDQIDNLLKESHNNYNLHICRLRYKNQIELLTKLIDVKRNEVAKKGTAVYERLKISSLVMQLERAEKNLSEINKRIENNSKRQDLYNINKELKKVNKEIQIEMGKNTHNAFELKILDINRAWLELRQRGAANRIKLMDGLVNRTKDGIVKQYDKARGFAKSIREVFVNEDDISSEKHR